MNRLVVIIFVILLVVAITSPWWGLIAALALVGWSTWAIAKKENSLLSLIYPGKEYQAMLSIVSLLSGLFFLFISSNVLIDRWKAEHKLKLQRQEEIARVEKERQEEQQRIEKLRNQATDAASKWESKLDSVESLELQGNLREALSQLNDDKKTMEPYLALNPIPEPIASLIPREQEIRRRIELILKILDNYEQLENKRKEASASIKDKKWLEADSAFTEALELLSKVRESSEDLKRYLPKSFSAEQIKKDIEKQMKQIKPKVENEKRKESERLAYIAICGEKPYCGGWDGECVGIASAVKRVAHDPGSIDIENCTDPVLTKDQCWVTTCDVRGKNMFGAMILQRKSFSISKLGIEEF